MLETRPMTDTPFPHAIASPPDDPRALRSAFGRFATGVTVVTASTPSGPVAITANSFSSVSLDPPLVLWSVGRHSKRFAAFSSCRHYAIHVLAADQADLCRRFARDGSDFSGMELALNAENVPVLGGALARFECAIENRVEGGDHLILIGRVLRMSAEDGDPLVFAAGRYGRIGSVA